MPHRSSGIVSSYQALDSGRTFLAREPCGFFYPRPHPLPAEPTLG